MDQRSSFHNHIAAFSETWASCGSKSALRDVKDMLLAPIYRRIDQKFDQKYNVNTYESVPLATLTMGAVNDDQDKRKYEPTSVITFKQMMSVLPRNLKDYVFIDIGSGKGRVLFMASTYNFKQVIGVELVYELHMMAKENIATYSSKRQRCFDICLVWGDASEFAIPEEKCVFYLFNPFLGAEDTMARVLDNISESFARYPRKMYFMYLNPVGSHVFDALGFVRLIERRRFALRKAIIYESVV
jgi:hypothetical protein